MSNVIRACDSLNYCIEYRSTDLEDQTNFPRAVPLSGHVLEIEKVAEDQVKLKTASGWLKPVANHQTYRIVRFFSAQWSGKPIHLRTHGKRHNGYSIE